MYEINPLFYGSVVFDTGLEAEIVSISLIENGIALVSLATGPHLDSCLCRYQILDVCGNIVLDKDSKQVSPVMVPELKEEDSSIVTLKILFVP
jgi:hypothetical protein